jgi:hypothetical protein
MLRVYADESETEATSICGYIAPADYWQEFCRKWQIILDDFRAPYFHFREFTTKELYSKAGNAYYNWSEKKRDKFLLDLAVLASEVAIPVGGSFTRLGKEKTETKEKRWENSLVKLFEDLNHVLSEVWPDYTGKILFVFDRCQDRKKLIPIHTVHGSFADKDSRFGGLAFEDDKDPMHLPLQAADLCSYVERQYVEKLREEDEKIKAPEPRMLDMILFRNRHEQLRKLSARQWKNFINTVREHREWQIAEWKRLGIKQVYYPNRHFPWEKYGNKNKRVS